MGGAGPGRGLPPRPGPALAAKGKTAIQNADDAGAARFYWVDDGAGYALMGTLPRERLLALASEAYRQLGLR